MAKEGTTPVAALWRDLFSLGVYKRSQGRVARQATFAVLAACSGLGVWSLQGWLSDQPLSVKYGVAGGVLVAALWISYRLVNWPQFADFLIAVEAEMNKVSWPSRTEMFRSSVVVMITIFGLAFVLFGYDLAWQVLLKTIGVLPS